MFEYLNAELKKYTKKHFSDLVYEYVFENNTELFLEYTEGLDSKVCDLNEQIVELYSKSRTDLEEMQLNDINETSRTHMQNKHAREEAVFYAKEFNAMLNESTDLFEYGSTLRKVLDEATSRSYLDIELVRDSYKNIPLNLSFNVLDANSYRDKKILAVNKEIDSIKNEKKWTLNHIEHITASKLLLEQVSKKAVLFSFEVIPLKCERSEFDLDVIKYVSYKNISEFPGNPAYNAVYEGTEFYSGSAISESDINRVLKVLDYNAKTQIVNINSEFDFKVIRKV